MKRLRAVREKPSSAVSPTFLSMLRWKWQNCGTHDYRPPSDLLLLLLWLLLAASRCFLVSIPAKRKPIDRAEKCLGVALIKMDAQTFQNRNRPGSPQVWKLRPDAGRFWSLVKPSSGGAWVELDFNGPVWFGEHPRRLLPVCGPNCRPDFQRVYFRIFLQLACSTVCRRLCAAGPERTLITRPC